MAVENDENLGLAFALVIGAGLSTALGAGVVFVPSLIELANQRTLAGALGLSAGVMTYVSFVEIFVKSNDSFIDAGVDEEKAYAYATICFFAGVLFMVTLNQIVTGLLGGRHHHHHHDDPTSGRRTGSVSQQSDAGHIPNPCPCNDDDPVATLDNIRNMADEIRMEQSDDQASSTHDQQPNEASNETKKEAETKHLMRMSINTALAIGLHNFPEGLATFVATLSDPGVGAVLAMAIAIHNIPEGLCVAMPIYYATGDRWRAFGYALLSGVAEPVAALLGWAILANRFSDKTYAILFGMVAGMMVIISARELLPTAHRYDPDDSVVTNSFMVGMAIMALSLVLFAL